MITATQLRPGQPGPPNYAGYQLSNFTVLYHKSTRGLAAIASHLASAYLDIRLVD